MYCGNCGNKLKRGQSFCNKCGTVVENNIEVSKVEVIIEKLKNNFKMLNKTHKAGIIVSLLVVLVIVVSISPHESSKSNKSNKTYSQTNKTQTNDFDDTKSEIEEMNKALDDIVVKYGIEEHTETKKALTRHLFEQIKPGMDYTQVTDLIGMQDHGVSKGHYRYYYWYTPNYEQTGEYGEVCFTTNLIVLSKKWHSMYN